MKIRNGSSCISTSAIVSLAVLLVVIAVATQLVVECEGSPAPQPPPLPPPGGRLVRTKYGALRGFTLPGSVQQQQQQQQSSGGGATTTKSVEAFLGVPYAAPPIGAMRYLPPTSPGQWTGTRLANQIPSACPQTMPDLSNRTASLLEMPRARYYQMKRMQLLLANQSEDCLYLNVYAPSEGWNGASLPVLVLIHGESYLWGAGHLMDGGQLAVNSRLVVVTLNYRLGILGFLQTAASPSPGQARGKSRSAIPTQGNYALLDIMAALVWLKDNVGGFGGDGGRLTLVGHGTGASIINLLMISPLASGLFQRAVLMAGSALSPGSLCRQAVALKIRVATEMDCSSTIGSSTSSAEMADIGDCLRKRPLDRLMELQQKLLNEQQMILGRSHSQNNNNNNQQSLLFGLRPGWDTPLFAPFVDGGGLVPLEPLLAMQSAARQHFGSIALVAGVTSVESYRQTPDVDLRDGLVSEDLRDRTLRSLVDRFYRRHLDEIFFVLRNEYSEWERAQDSLTMRDSVASLLSDALIVAPLMHVVHLHQEAATTAATYFYHYQGYLQSPSPPSSSPVQQHQQQQQSLFIDPSSSFVQDAIAADTEHHRLGSVTGDELELLQLDASTKNGYIGYQWPSSHPNNASGSSSVLQQQQTTAVADSSISASQPYLLQFITAFATTGDPNLEIGSKGELVPRSRIRWEPFNLRSQYYIVFTGSDHVHIKSHYRGHHVAVWLQLIPQLHGRLDPSNNNNNNNSDNRTASIDPAVSTHYQQRIRNPQQGGAGGSIQQQQYQDWLANPNVMASEGAVDADGTLVHGVASAADGLDSIPSAVPPGSTIGNAAAVDKVDQQQQQRETSGGGGGASINQSSQRIPAPSSSGNIFVANQAALSITLVVGSFFLVINILLLAAVYQHRSRSSRITHDNCNATIARDDGVVEAVPVSAAAAVSCESVTDLRRYHHQGTTLIPLQTLPTPTRQLSTSDSLVLLGSCQTLTSDVMTASSSANTLTAAAATANANVRSLVQHQQQQHHNESPPYLMRSPPPPPLCFQMSDTVKGGEIAQGQHTNTIGRNKINAALPVPVPMPPPAASAAKSTHEITV